MIDVNSSNLAGEMVMQVMQEDNGVYSATQSNNNASPF